MILTRHIIVFVSIRARDFLRRDFNGNGHKKLSVFCERQNGGNFPCSIFLWPTEMTSTTKCSKFYFHWSFEHSGVLSVVGYKSTDQQTMGNSCRHVNHENTFSNYHSLK